jgi:hypothetical protein
MILSNWPRSLLTVIERKTPSPFKNRDLFLEHPVLFAAARHTLAEKLVSTCS